jgi:hypothetical protein
MYIHEAMKAPNLIKFKQAMVTEFNEHIKRKHWEPVLKSDIPEKYKWKSRLDLGGHKMIKGLHYEDSYSPVISWQNIRLLFIFAVING